MTAWLLALACGLAAAGEPATTGSRLPKIPGIDFAQERREVVDRGTVAVNGVRYRKFEYGRGSILVPNVAHFTAADFDRAFCAGSGGVTVPQGPGPSQRDAGIEQDAVVSRAEVRSGGDDTVKVFAELIQKTVVRKCGMDGSTGTTPAGINPNLGVSIKPGNPDRAAIKEYRLYNKGLAPNVNLDLKF